MSAPSPQNWRLLALCFGLILALLSLDGCKPKPPESAQIAAPSEVAFEPDEKADPITVLATLADHEKLRTLKPEARSVNGRFDKILYWLFVAEQKKIVPGVAMAKALDLNGTTEPRRTMVLKQVQTNYLTAKLWGMFTPENCLRLKRGNAALITKGSFIGQIVEVDHIVPVSRYPQFANELANLQLMPAMQNRAKGNRMGEAEFEKLRQLQALSPAPVTRNGAVPESTDLEQ